MTLYPIKVNIFTALYRKRGCLFAVGGGGGEEGTFEVESEFFSSSETCKNNGVVCKLSNKATLIYRILKRNFGKLLPIKGPYYCIM